MRKETFKKVFRGVCIAVLVAMLFSFAPQGVTATNHENTTAPSLGGKLLATILSYELASIGGLSQLLFTFMQYTVNPQVGVISNTWKIVRDFCNIFFILIMIVMAFGTIFDIGNYKLTPDLITRLIIVAVLINFSLVISGLFITGMDTINSVFLKAVGDPGARIQQALKPTQIIGGDGTSFLGSIGAIAAQNGCFLATATGGVGGVLAYQTKCYDAIATASGLPSDSQVWAVTLRLFFTVLLVGIVLFGLLGATFFAIIRIPFLWFLLIFSPMAAFASILPATRDGWNKWLKEFIAWNTYLPIYLVVLYFGLYLLSQRNDILSGLNRIPGQFLTSPILGFGFTPEEIFFYVLVGFVLWGGTAFALSVSRSSGGMATDIGAKWSRAAAGFVFRAPVTLVSKSRVGDYYEGIKTGAVGKFTQIRQEGVPLPTFKVGKQAFGGPSFGKRQGEERQQRVAAIFGGAPQVEAQKTFASGVDKALSALKEQETAGQLQVDQNFINKAYDLDATTTEGAARRALLYERGMINNRQFVSDMDVWGKKNPSLAEKMSDRAKKAGYKGVRSSLLLSMAARPDKYPAALRREWFSFLKEEKGNDPAFKVITPNELQEGVSVFGGEGTNEADAFKRAVSNKRPDVVAEYNINNIASKRGSPLEDEIYEQIKNKKASEIGGYLEETFAAKDKTTGVVTINDPFFKALQRKMKELDVKKGVGTPGTPGYKPSGGQQFKDDLEKEVINNPVKFGVVDLL